MQLHCRTVSKVQPSIILLKSYELLNDDSVRRRVARSFFVSLQHDFTRRASAHEIFMETLTLPTVPYFE